MKAVIFHGWGSSSRDNWFLWLKAELEVQGFEVILPDLPDSQYPKQEEWIKAALELTDYDNDTILIGHSLGTILIMRLLEKVKAKAAFLAAGFDEDLYIPELMNFFEKPFDYEKIKKNAGKIYMLSSDNDPYIPLDIAKRLSKNLDCELRVFQGKNHLSAGTQEGAFPELREMILNETD